MPDPIIDRDAIIEKAAAAALEADPDDYRVPSDIRAALPSIADDLLAPIEAIHQRVPLHNPEDECECGNRDTHEIGYDEWGDPICLSEEPINWVCAECYRDDGETGEWPCPTAQAVAAIREAVRA